LWTKTSTVRAYDELTEIRTNLPDCAAIAGKYTCKWRGSICPHAEAFELRPAEIEFKADENDKKKVVAALSVKPKIVKIKDAAPDNAVEFRDNDLWTFSKKLECDKDQKTVTISTTVVECSVECAEPGSRLSALAWVGIALAIVAFFGLIAFVVMRGKKGGDDHDEEDESDDQEDSASE